MRLRTLDVDLPGLAPELQGLRIAHGDGGDGAARGPYGEGSFPRPFLPGEDGTPPAGGDQGMGSRTQADVTPGAEPTRKPGGGA